MADDAARDFRRLQQLLGQTLFQWCGLERVLEQALRDLEAELPPGLSQSARLAAWKRAIEHKDPALASEAMLVAREANRLRAFRNLVVHHLVEVSGAPGGDPFIRCEKRRGQGLESRRVTLAELEATVMAIDECRTRLWNTGRFRHIASGAAGS